MAAERVLVVDFGSQYSHLIAQRVRRLGVFSEVVRPEDFDPRALGPDVKGVILSGGPSSVYEEGAPRVDVAALAGRVPVLGICYGHQLIAHELGGRVERAERGEYGRVTLYVDAGHPLLDGVPSGSVVWMSHRDEVVEPPEGFAVLAHTDYCGVAAMADDARKLYGVQFHPEVTHTEYGDMVLRNFLYSICGCRGGWSPMSAIEEFVRENRGLRGRAIVAVSGGVDSTVTAVVLRRVFGDNLHVVFIDTGLLREGEAEYVRKLFQRLGFKNFHAIDASERFLSRLRGVTDPEEKRRVISRTFFEVLEEAAGEISRRYGRVEYLGQGTLYPDRVESGATSRHADRIKSHHNVVMAGGVGLKLLEPLRDLYKDEVREVARRLGLPEEVWKRHPFPGPGLAIRIVGEVTEEKLRILRKADRIVEEELRASGVYDRVWQGFPVLLSIRTVGVKGDRRSYEYAVALRVVDSVNAMTASFTKLPWELLERIANRIVNEVEGVNRVLYDVTNKPPATIEFE
ncbi:GMP synthase (glutamine-hydrolyzing) [Candidatus Geothermarchaeota archaeon ex4572_27]|nr:MAG: GMP synthase (glutamine-hydrolyzing) [Candidatus Geothermarchaeota archaeon ex4572_27]